MIRTFFRRKLDSQEHKLGASMDYLRHVVDVSPTLFLRFASVMPFANSRKELPADAWYVAQLAAVQGEDCGPCLQITVNLALQDGVPPELVRAALDGDDERLGGPLSEVRAFAAAVASAAPVDEELRAGLRRRYGERGLIELAYAIASGRIPPTVKRALGFAQSCTQVRVEVGAPVEAAGAR